MRDAATRLMSASSNGDCIPSELKHLPQWVLWRYETRPVGKGSTHQTKVPCRTDGRRASSTDPKTWYCYERATATFSNNSHQFAGIGFVFAKDDPYCGIDLDNSLNQDGSLKPWAEEIVCEFAGVYMEVSPSGHGVKIWAKGKLPGPGKQFRISEDERIEMYDRGRFFAVTGRLYGNPVEFINDHQADIDRSTVGWCRLGRVARALVTTYQKLTPKVLATTPWSGKLVARPIGSAAIRQRRSRRYGSSIRRVAARPKTSGKSNPSSGGRAARRNVQINRQGCGLSRLF